MNRRSFLKPIAAGALGGFFPAAGHAADPVHAAEVPETAFDSPDGTWTLAVLPDTQTMTRLHPEMFVRQTEWIAKHRKSHDIRFVAQLGDITDNNVPGQWANAKRAVDVLRDAGVPFSLLPGNHDLGPNGGCADRSTLMNDFFKPEDYRNSGKVTYFETGRMENSAHEFDSPQGKYLLLALEFGPRDEVVGWADRVIAAHAEHAVIVTTHVYLYSDDTRYDFPAKGKTQTWNPNTYGVAKLAPVNDGEALWEKLVLKHANVRFVLNGHVLNDGAGRLSSPGASGKPVHQILSNYQGGVKPDRPFRGGGFMRLMRFLPDGKTVSVKTYSPWLDAWLTDGEQQFELTV